MLTMTRTSNTLLRQERPHHRETDSKGMVTVFTASGEVWDDYCRRCLDDAHRGEPCKEK